MFSSFQLPLSTTERQRMKSISQSLDEMPISDSPHLNEQLETWMRETKLDAYQQGMTDAAKVVIDTPINEDYGKFRLLSKIEKKILTTSDNKTEI